MGERETERDKSNMSDLNASLYCGSGMLGKQLSRPIPCSSVPSRSSFTKLLCYFAFYVQSVLMPLMPLISMQIILSTDCCFVLFLY